MANYDLNDDQVVVIVGSGAGGGTLAARICAAGIPVVMLEAGAPTTPEEYIQDEHAAAAQLSWSDERLATGSWNIATESPTAPTWICKVLGGTTVHWTGMALRFKPYEFAPLSTYGAIAGSDLIDWPVSWDELDPYYVEAEKRMGVSGLHGLPSHPLNNHSRVFWHGARRAGFKQLSQGHMAINVEPYAGRPGSLQDGFTMQGDRRNAKWSTAVVDIPEAMASGKLDLRTRCRAVEIEHGADNEVTAVVYVDGTGGRKRQKCRYLVLAGNAIETPRLLLASASGRFPNGLGNGSDKLGRYYMRHTTGSVWGTYEKPVRMYRGENMTAMVCDEARHDPARGFANGYYLQVLGISLPAIAKGLKSGWWGREFAEMIERYGSMAGFYAMGEDLPQPGNRVSLHASRVDEFGVPIACIHCDDHPNDIRMREHAYASMRRIHDGAGAVKVVTAAPYPASHNMGTTRMSRDPADGVVDPTGRVHEMRNLYVNDGSVFCSSASANPTLTIVALSLRLGDHLKRVLAN
ncbi:MAG: 2-keto-gluconate dehydrogenase [Rhodovulum sulfidophilum]|uniref:2-keto-gluconate dehydrogenase n=1 Tax=Rhodovulum sulfidophilum TaxID=35806 RepID=A0A2W5MXH7_RHOSU|nr:MAG: 2-keto-gluconate dehydrogenase [Rhodovulum sulfidophilum]